MKKPISFGSIGFEIVASMEGSMARPEPGDPFRICIIGDFSGRASRNVKEPLTSRRPILIDRDTIEEVILKIRPRLVFEVMGQTIEASFEGLDSFHPDELFSRLDLFRALKETRGKLEDPRTYNAALKELRILTGAEGKEAGPGEKAQGKPVSPGGNILDQIVSDTEEGTLEKTGSSGQPDLADFVNAIVRPYRVAPHDPAQDRLKEAIDTYISVLMAEVLHHGCMQEIEAAWRCMHFLVSRVETDEDLEIRVLDISKEELARDLLAADDLTSTDFYRLFVEEAVSSPDGKPWAVLVGDYTFDHDDAAVLGRMAKIAAAAGAPFIARAHPHLIGCRTFAETPDPAEWKYTPGPDAGEAWDALRNLPEAAYIGLAAPRFLLRLPYGRDTDPVEVFDFEETAGEFAHEHYLWGNPAFACACLLAQAFSRLAWSMTPGVVNDIEGLPLHSTEVNGESRLTPCAEILLTEKAAQAILDQGIMPLATIRGTDSARLVRFQSLALPPARLQGRWEGSTHSR